MSNKTEWVIMQYMYVHMYIFFKVILNIEKRAFWTAPIGESLRRSAIVFLIPIF